MEDALSAKERKNRQAVACCRTSFGTLTSFVERTTKEDDVRKVVWDVVEHVQLCDVHFESLDRGFLVPIPEGLDQRPVVGVDVDRLVFAG